MSPVLRIISAGLEFLSAVVVAVNAGSKIGEAWDDLQEQRAQPYPEVPDDVIDISDCGEWYRDSSKQ